MSVNELEQHIRLAPTCRVPDQYRLDVAVSKCQQRSGPIAGRSSQEHEQRKLNSVPFVIESHLRRGLLSFKNLEHILDVHRCLFPFLRLKLEASS